MKKINKIIKITFVVLAILFIVPSVIYLIQNKTVFGFNNYYNFFINDGSNKILSSILYLVIFLAMTAIYIVFIKKKDIFKNIKELLIYTGIASSIFILMLPWTTSDIFYYMGVGELDSVYGQNPYYVTMHKYYEENKENIQDEILEQGANNFWADTVVVYGPIAQLIFKILTAISFKNINVCIILFKLFNIAIHILNCYLIYKMTKNLKFVIIYGLNPFILLEFFGQVHNDITIVLFVLLSLYFLKEKKKLIPSLIFLAIATGIKYFTILLLPVILLYYFRDEEKLLKKFMKCVGYGLLFLAMFGAEYILYFKDISVMTSMGAQTQRYCKSLYSGLYSIGFINKDINQLLDWNKLRIDAHWVVFVIFVLIYEAFCIKLLVTKKNDLEKSIQGYNDMLILFMMSLSNFQQWYLIWFFATIIWQKRGMMKDIIVVTTASEIANSVYMFKIESWRYDYIFVLTIIFIYIIWKLWSKILFKENSCKI